MKRYARNNQQQLTHDPKDAKTAHDLKEFNDEQILTTEHFFTEHALDSTQNALLKNCTTKSMILAPFNSTRSHLPQNELSQQQDAEGEPIFPPLDIDENMIIDRKAIKFAARVKDINRQYEMNNNCELDNGVYNKFVRQSTQKEGEENDDKLTTLSIEGKNLMNSPSMDNSNRKGRCGPTAPLVS